MKDPSATRTLTLNHEPYVIKLIVNGIYDTIYELDHNDIPDTMSARLVHIGVYMCAHRMGMSTIMKFALASLKNELWKHRLTLKELELLVTDYKLFTSTFCSRDATKADIHQELMVLLASHIIFFPDNFPSDRSYDDIVMDGPYLHYYVDLMAPEDKYTVARKPGYRLESLGKIGNSQKRLKRSADDTSEAAGRTPFDSVPPPSPGPFSVHSPTTLRHVPVAHIGSPGIKSTRSKALPGALAAVQDPVQSPGAHGIHRCVSATPLRDTYEDDTISLGPTPDTFPFKSRRIRPVPQLDSP